MPVLFGCFWLLSAGGEPGSDDHAEIRREAEFRSPEFGVFQPVQARPIKCAVEVGRPCCGGCEVVDHHRSTGGEQAGGIRSAVALGLTSAVEHEQVVRAMVCDAPPVTMKHVNVFAVSENLRRDASPFQITFDEPGSIGRAGGQLGEADTASSPRLAYAARSPCGQHL